jgi:hypothetical protein
MEAAPQFIKSMDLPPCVAFYDEELEACELWIDDDEPGAAKENELQCRTCTASNRIGMETYGSPAVAGELVGTEADLALCVDTLGQLNVGIAIGHSDIDWIEYLGVRSLKAAHAKHRKNKTDEDN